MNFFKKWKKQKPIPDYSHSITEVVKATFTFQTIKLTLTFLNKPQQCNHRSTCTATTQPDTPLQATIVPCYTAELTKQGPVAGFQQASLHVGLLKLLLLLALTAGDSPMSEIHL